MPEVHQNQFNKKPSADQEISQNNTWGRWNVTKHWIFVDPLWETTSAETRKKVFSIQVPDRKVQLYR